MPTTGLEPVLLSEDASKAPMSTIFHQVGINISVR